MRKSVEYEKGHGGGNIGFGDAVFLSGVFLKGDICPEGFIAPMGESFRNHMDWDPGFAFVPVGFADGISADCRALWTPKTCFMTCFLD